MRGYLSRRHTRAGFTLVEVIVTVVIAAVFIAAFTQLHITQSRISSVMTAYAQADLLAYNNLRIFANGKTPTWFDCNYTGSVADPMTLLTSTDPVNGIPSPVIQSVIATAPYGCGGGSAGIGYPIRVVSTVTYGKDAKVIVHATYSTY